MYIALSADRKYYSHMRTMIRQLRATQNTLEGIYALIEDDTLPDIDLEGVKCINANRLDWLNGENSNLKTKFTRMSLARLFLPSIAPDLKKILYLDLDITINGSLQELWEVNMDNYSIAGVIDVNIYNHRYLEIMDVATYLNSGVLLMNLEKLREMDAENKFISLLEENKYRFPDQDVINIVCDGTKRVVSNKWNSSVVSGISFRPVIVHHITFKPWNDASNLDSDNYKEKNI